MTTHNYALFLDDRRQVYDVKWVQLSGDLNWLVAKSYGEFVSYIMDLGLPEFVSFDHDLAEIHYKVSIQENYEPGPVYDYGPEKTGMDAVKWLVDYCMVHKKKLPKYAVHSLNGVASQRMEDYIKKAKEQLDI